MMDRLRSRGRAGCHGCGRFHRRRRACRTTLQLAWLTVEPNHLREFFDVVAFCVFLAFVRGVVFVLYCALLLLFLELLTPEIWRVLSPAVLGTSFLTLSRIVE